MKKRIYGKDEFITGKWSGGETSEFAIYPESASYIDRDFIWRLSSASVEVEESTFTRLQEYDRILMVIEGDAILVHGDVRTAKLSAFEQDSFSGNAGTKCFGKIKDYNLIMREGCSGNLKVMELQNEAQNIEKSSSEEYTHASYGFYCLDGYAVISVGGQTHMVGEGKQLILDLDEGESAEFSVMGEGRIIAAEIFYNRFAHAAVEIPEEKAGFEDFKTAFKLARGSSKWQKAMNRDKAKEFWYDEALSSKLSLLEKSYIGMIIWVLVSVIFVIMAVKGFSHVYAVMLIIIWTILYAMVISPLIYMIVLPKPIKAHIKSVETLTEYERHLYEKELDENEITDKLLKKYKHSSGDGWNVAGDSILSKLKK